MMRESSVCVAIAQFRDLVNNHAAIKNELLKDSQKWAQVCAGMDVIEDTDLAITAYRSLKADEDEDTGFCYLIVYGLLQTLVVQQEAVKGVSQALSAKCDLRERLKYVRDIRNCAVGHPTMFGTGRQSDSSKKSYGINRRSLSVDGFAYYSFDRNDGSPQQDVSLQDLIADQESAVSDALDKLVQHLKQRFACD